MPLQIIRQDITKMRVDAIINTTNEEFVLEKNVRFAQLICINIDNICNEYNGDYNE